MNRRRLATCIALLAALFVLGMPVSAKAAYKWVSAGNGNMRCYKGSKLVTNAWVSNKHLNGEGYMDRNMWLTRKINGVDKKVFVRDDGLMVENFKAGWQKINKKYYYYTAKGELVRSKWITIPKEGKYYVNASGYRVTGLQKFKDGYRYFDSAGRSKVGWQTIKKKRYYFRSGTRLALAGGIFKFTGGKSYCFNAKGVLQTGWQKQNKKWYYFNPEMKTGWVTIKNKKYYLDSANGRVSGVYGIGGQLYYFKSNGVMQTSKSLGKTTFSYDGRNYTIASNGVCTLVPDSKAPSNAMLFFLTFESGSEAYDQTGGDNGNACGAYQFDNRYSLLPFVKYAYSQNAGLCAEFKLYAAYTDGTKLKSNKKFYKAWHAIYKRNPKLFAELQDRFARQNYYDPVETALARAGINLATRSDIVKGAVYSYSIQHGQTAAVNAVKACKITGSTTDAQFIKKLYKYRIKKFPAYRSRYTAEQALALSKL